MMAALRTRGSPTARLTQATMSARGSEGTLESLTFAASSRAPMSGCPSERTRVSYICRAQPLDMPMAPCLLLALPYPTAPQPRQTHPLAVGHGHHSVVPRLVPAVFPRVVRAAGAATLLQVDVARQLPIAGGVSRMASHSLDAPGKLRESAAARLQSGSPRRWSNDWLK